MKCILLVLFYLFIKVTTKLEPQNETSSFELEEFIYTYLSDKLLIIITSDKFNNDTIFSIHLKKTIITNISKVEKLCGNFIFQVTEVSYLHSLMNKFNLTANWSKCSSKFLFIVSKIQDGSKIKSIFALLWSYYIYNVVIYTNNNFYTWYPYDRINNCGQSVNTIIKYTNKNPYVDKIPNELEKCRINITFEPFKIIIDPTGKKGMIGSFVHTIFDVMKVKVDITKSNYVSEHVKTGNYDNLIYLLETQNIEFAPYSAHYGTQMRNYQCEYTRWVIEENFYVATLPRRPIGSNLLLVFSDSVFVLHILTLITIVFIWKFLNNIHFVSSFWNIFKLFLTYQINLNKIEKSISLIFILFVSWYITHFNIFYQTNLSSLLMRPRLTPKINTLDDFVLTDQKVVIPGTVKYFLSTRGPEFYQKITQKMIEITSIELYVSNFTQYLNKSKYAMTVSTADLLSIKNAEYIEVILKDPVSIIFVYEYIQNMR